jgi:HSP20 family molecular chaperone IbpA
MNTEKKDVTTTEEQQPLETEEVEREEPYFSPDVDIIEKQDSVVILADLPGVSKEDVDATFEQGMLTIRGRSKPHEDENMALEVQEYDEGSFYRRFAVGEGLDTENIEAKLNNGVLRLVIPKSEQYQTKKIEITGE